MFGEQKVCFSGVQPSGNLTIGNYLGAIKNFAEYSEKYKTFYCVVDEHAITVRQNPAELEEAMKSSLVQTDDKFADLYEDILYSYGLSFEEENVYLKLIGITRRTRTIE